MFYLVIMKAWGGGGGGGFIELGQTELTSLVINKFYVIMLNGVHIGKIISDWKLKENCSFS